MCIQRLFNKNRELPAIPLPLWRRRSRQGSALVLAISMVLPVSAFAQAIDTSKIQASVTSLTNLLQQLAGIFLVLLLMAGASLLMWGGFNPNLQRTGIRGVALAVIGAALVFLFAAPLSQFFVSTFTSAAA